MGMPFTPEDRLKAATERRLREEKRKSEQASRVCFGCEKEGFSPCQSIGLECSDWCQGEHICYLEGQPYCYDCINKALSSKKRKK